MEFNIREYQNCDISEMIQIWNKIILEGNAFPQTNTLSFEEAEHFFAEQSFTGVAENDREIIGLYILHPNNIGRCSHLANASYAVKSSKKGLHIGEQLVKHSLRKSKELNFKILQFNAVVKTNLSAIHLYEKLGFTKLGVIPKGFLMKDGSYEDIILFYYNLYK